MCRSIRASVIVSSLANEAWPKQSKADAFDMSDLYSASRPIEASMDFPHISWTHEQDDLNAFSRRSASCSDALVAPLHSNLVVTSWSSSSLLGKRRRSRTSGKLSSRQQRLVRSIALDADLALLVTPSEPQSIQDTTQISPIRIEEDCNDERLSTFSNRSIYTAHSAQIEASAHGRNIAHLNDCLRVMQGSDLGMSSPSPKSPS
jgi:hypothetical protein